MVMKLNRLTYKILLAVALVLLLNFVLHHLYHRFMIINRVNEHQDEQFEELDSLTGCLLIGNSHNPLNPDVLGNSFNYASPHELFPQTYFKLKAALEHPGIHPKFVVLPVDASAFSPYAAHSMRFHDYWVKFVDYPQLYKETGESAYLRALIMANTCSYIGNYTYIWQSIGGLFIDFSPMKNGYRPPRDFKNWQDVPNKMKTGWERAHSFLSTFDDSQPHPLMLDYFERILKLCEEKGINVVLYRSPLTKEFLINADKFIDYQKFDGIIDSVCRKYDNIDTVFDYRTVFKGRPDLFFNADHVNPEGADSLTRILLMDLNAVHK